MTPEQEQALLNKVAQLERRLEEIGEQQDVWTVNGANDLLGGYGFQQIGRNFRFQKGGLQILAPEEITSLIWLSKFVTGFDPSVHFPHVEQAGAADPDANQEAEWSVNARYSQVKLATIAISADADESTLRLRAASQTGADAIMVLFAEEATGAKYVQIDETPLWLGVFTSDPSVLDDGMVWYRSDTDEYRVRINGVSYSLLTSASSFLEAGDNITDLDATAHRTFYSDGSGDIQELAHGAAGQVLTSAGATSAPAWQDAGGGMKQVTNNGYYVIPAGPGVGTSVTAGSGSMGSWAELIASTAEAVYITHVVVEDAAASNTYWQIEIGTGAALSEVTVGMVKIGQIGTSQTVSPITLPMPIAVASGTRIAARAASSAANAVTVSLIVVAQADTADI